MTIPEQQLDTWANQGASASSASTYDTIRTCIEGGSWKSDVFYNIYLQGSYKNSTNIYGNSDVDIIVEFTSIFYSDTSELDSVGKEIHDSYGPGAYSLQDFKAAIIVRLKECFGESNVVPGNIAIKIAKGTSSRLDADVLVCANFKKYKSNNGSTNLESVEGIRFKEENTGKYIVNYPKPHYDNGVLKNQIQRTHENLKKTTRIIKNMKANLVNHQELSSQIAPSYFVECLVYNAKDSHFRHSTYRDILLHILSQFHEDDASNACDNYLCQNQQSLLFGSSNQQWDRQSATFFIGKLIKLWNNYPLP